MSKIMSIFTNKAVRFIAFIVILTMLVSSIMFAINVTPVQAAADGYANLSYKMSVTESSYNSVIERGLYAVDGNVLSSHWCATQTVPQWMTVDLGEVCSIREWNVKHAGYSGEPPSTNTRDFKLQMSIDGVSFTDADTVTDNTSNETDRLVSATGRYVRLYVTNAGSDGTTRVNQFTVYGYRNIARFSNIFEDIKQSSYNGYYMNTINPFDGKDGTYWHTTQSAPQWLQIDLKDIYQIRQYIVRHAESAGLSSTLNTRDFKLQCSLDGVSFSDVDTITDNTQKITSRDVFFTARYVRLYITNPGSDGYTRIPSLELYGYKNLCVGKTITASSALSRQEGAQYGADGDAWHNHWCTQQAAPQWLMTDLGQTYNINQWVVKNCGYSGENPANNTRDYKLQVSNDGVNFTDADIVTGNTQNSTARYVSASGRYVRLYVTNAGGDGVTRINDFEVYGIPAEPVSAPTNPVTHDEANLFEWTCVDGYPNFEYYEYSIDAGSTWKDCTGNPQRISNSNYVAGNVMVRIKPDFKTGRSPGSALANTAEFTSGTFNYTPRIVTNLSIAQNDVVVSTHDVVADFGADNTGINDSTQAFQDAIDYAYAAKGGIVFVPAGTYKFDGHIVLRRGVTLRGEWRNPDSNPTAAGTILMPYEGKGNEDASPFILMDSNSALKNISIWYPEQSAANVFAYPWTIAEASLKNHAVTIHNVTLYNSYKGIKIGASELYGTSENYLDNIYMTNMKLGIQVEEGWNLDVCNNICIDAKYWADSGLQNSPASPAAFKDYTRSNLIGIKTGSSITGGHLDAHSFYNINIADANIGIDNAMYWGTFMKFNISNCNIGIKCDIPLKNYFTRQNNIFGPAYGVTFAGGTITGYNAAGTRGIYFTGYGQAQFQGITINGNADYGIYSDTEDEVLHVHNCTLANYDAYGIYVVSGKTMIEDSTFTPSTNHIYLGNKVTGASVLGNTFTGGRNVTNNVESQHTSNIIMGDTALGAPVLPSITTTYSFIPESKPANPTNFYNVDDYGAVKSITQDEPVTDSTSAIQSALNAASAAGGGTVFIPAGYYRCDGTLTIPSGVELRGVNEDPRLGDDYGTILLSYANKNNPGGTPFITMNQGSMLKGLRIYYPEMPAVAHYSENEPAYPFTIRGAGSDILIRNVAICNSWDAVDLFTNRCDNFMLSGVWSNSRNTGIFAGGGSENGKIERAMFVWGVDEGEEYDLTITKNGPCYRRNDHNSETAKYPLKFGRTEGLTLLQSGVFLPYGDGSFCNGTGTWFVSEAGGSSDNANILQSISDVGYQVRFQAGGTINLICPESSVNPFQLENTFTGTVNVFAGQSNQTNSHYVVKGGTLNVVQGNWTGVIQDAWQPTVSLEGGTSNFYNFHWKNRPLTNGVGKIVNTQSGITSAAIAGSGGLEGVSWYDYGAGIKLTMTNNIDVSRYYAAKGNVLRLKGTTDGQIKYVDKYVCYKVANISRTWQEGDYIEYDVRVDSSEANKAEKTGGIEIINTDGSCFSNQSGWIDQWNASGNPDEDLSYLAQYNWLHRKLPVPESMVGKTGSYLELVLDGNDASKTYAAYYDNIVITNSGSTIATLYSEGAPALSQLEGSNGYSDISLIYGDEAVQSEKSASNWMKYLVTTDSNPETYNKFAYAKFKNHTYTFKQGDFIEYDVKIDSDVTGIGGIDIKMTDGSYFRDCGAIDQNNIGCHPGADISGYAYNKWYHRKIPVPASLVGKTTSYFDVAAENDSVSFTFAAYYDNIVITDGEIETTVIYKTGTPPDIIGDFGQYYTYANISVE